MPRLTSRFAILSCALVLAFSASAGAQTRVLTPDDYYRLQAVGDSKLSPDGRYLLYTVQTRRREQNDRITHIWYTDLRTGVSRRLSTQGINSTGPNWTPDGKRIYFTTTRGNESGLHFINFLEPGGEAYRIPGITAAPNYSPDGSWILVARSIAPGENPNNAPDAPGGGGGRGGRGGGAGAAPADSAACWPAGTPALTGPSAPTTRGKTESARMCDVYVITHATYKRDGTYSFLPPTPGGDGRGGGRGGRGGAAPAGGAGGRNTQFFRMSVDGIAADRPLVQLTTDGVNKNFESISPDGKWILYTVGGGPGGGRGGGPPEEGTTEAGGAAAQMPEVGIFRVSSAGGGAPIEVAKVRGTVSGVRMSPDAKYVALTLTEGRRRDPIVRVLDVATGKTVSDIGRGWKYPITTVQWSPTSKEVSWLSGVGATDQIVKAAATGGPIVNVTKGLQTISSLTYDAAQKTMAYVKSTMELGGEVFVANADGTGERQVTNVNTEFMKNIRIGKSELFSYPGVPHNRAWLDSLKTKGVPAMFKGVAPSGERPRIEAMVLYPPDYQPGRKYPMVTYVHGGPHGRYSVGFNHEFQMVAAQGIVILYTNPRGSTNYGNDFQYMTLNAWGIDDAKDILQAVDSMVARGVADPTKLAISGGSYGGFMTNWLSAQDQRWKTAATDRSISNWISFYGVSDASSLVEGEFDGMPWPYLSPDSGSYLLATMLSPIVWADKVKAPTLIIHSLNDYRVPFEEGEQWYRALKKHNIPVKMVGFPDSSHGLGGGGEPWLSVRRLKEYVDWFKAYLVDDKPLIAQ
ncbi:MAG TPA: S9 family peptidase [Gemmatimonadaceae bacterium]|nr:S9 family peptidase [Gemmatimonadaceae bacterium]